MKLLLTALLILGLAVTAQAAWKDRTETNTAAQFIGAVAATDSAGKVATSFKPTTAGTADAIIHQTGQVWIEPAAATTKWTNSFCSSIKSRLQIMASHDTDSLQYGVQIAADPDSAKEPSILLNLMWKDWDWHSAISSWPTLLRARSNINESSTIFYAGVEDTSTADIHRGFEAKSTLDHANNELFFANAEADDSTYAFRAHGGQNIYQDQSKTRFVNSRVRLTRRNLVPTQAATLTDFNGSLLAAYGDSIMVGGVSENVLFVGTARNSVNWTGIRMPMRGTSWIGIDIAPRNVITGATGIKFSVSNLDSLLGEFDAFKFDNNADAASAANFYGIYATGGSESRRGHAYYQDKGRFFISGDSVHVDAPTRLHGDLTIGSTIRVTSAQVAGYDTLVAAGDSANVPTTVVAAGDTTAAGAGNFSKFIITLTPCGTGPTLPLFVKSINVGTPKGFTVGGLEGVNDIPFQWKIERRN